MKHMNRVNILSKFFYKISFENMEKFKVENPIFQRGGGQIWPPLVLNGLIKKALNPKFLIFQVSNSDILQIGCLLNCKDTRILSEILVKKQLNFA